MATGSGFYKGDKKKPKQKEMKNKLMFSDAPVFRAPEIIKKKKNE